MRRQVVIVMEMVRVATGMGNVWVVLAMGDVEMVMEMRE